MKIVIKVGSLGVTNPDGGADVQKIQRLLSDINELKKMGHTPILVSSGAINSAKIIHSHLAKTNELHTTDLAKQQAKAAIGQPVLMKYYLECAEIFKMPLAQILVTHEDFKNRQRFLNIRNTLYYLMENHVLCIVNENDTVSSKEITVGDNDQLAAIIAQCIQADLLILLTEADGLFDQHPSNPKAKHFKEIDFQDDFKNIQFAGKTSVGRGGMLSKVQAIRKLTPIGMDVILATFDREKPILRAFSGNGGTLFHGNPTEKIKERKSWIATVAKTECTIYVDQGASEALKKNASLLPVGVTKIAGSFKRGDVVAINHSKNVIGFGISEYDSTDIELIKGKKSQEISTILKEIHNDVIIHKNNLFLKR